MKNAYIVTSGSIFGLIVLAHAARVVAEGAHVVREPFFDVMTILAAALAIWSCRVARS